MHTISSNKDNEDEASIPIGNPTSGFVREVFCLFYNTMRGVEKLNFHSNFSRGLDFLDNCRLFLLSLVRMILLYFMVLIVWADIFLICWRTSFFRFSLFVLWARQKSNKIKNRFQLAVSSIKSSFSPPLHLIPAGIYLLKVNGRNTRTRCEIWSKLIVKTYFIIHIFWIYLTFCCRVSIINVEFVIAGWIFLLHFH